MKCTDFQYKYAIQIDYNKASVPKSFLSFQPFYFDERL